MIWFYIDYTANLPTNIVKFREFDSSIILILRGGSPWKKMIKAMLVGD